MSLNSQQRRILTIDDNDAIHSDFRKILCGNTTAAAPKLASGKALLFGKANAAAPAKIGPSFEVESALQGEEGLAKLKVAVAEGRPFQVAFVDMRMPPGWDGLQTIQRLWEVDPDLQVVICSAYSDYSWDEISAKLGLTDRLLILKKPFDPAEVTQIATALSEKWHLRQSAKLRMDELERMVQERTAKLEEMAMSDKLTGLGNRALFTDRLAKSIERRKADKSYQYAVMFFDFDRFKVVNDSLGHEAGDLVLKGIADRLSAALQLAGPVVGDALACRLGGDEFTILIDGFTAGLDPHAFANELLKILATPYKVSERDIYCTASIAITTGDLEYTAAADAIRDADTAMYHAKAAGKARYVFFDRSMHEAMTRRVEMEHDLRHAVERKEFELAYQPIVSLATGELVGFEALARWYHPTRGVIQPLEFIACCEEINIIGEVGAWILETACRQMKAWRDAAPHMPGLSISVNLSRKQLNDPSLVDQIRNALTKTGLPPSALTLEITETAIMNDPTAGIEICSRIRSLGVGLHLDDFGTGYSSLSCLHQFPINGVKIDRSFVKNVSERRDYAAVVNAIINLARHLNVQVIVEGIENDDQMTLLHALECDMAQGFHFGKPLPAAEAVTWLESKTLNPRLAA